MKIRDVGFFSAIMLISVLNVFAEDLPAIVSTNPEPFTVDAPRLGMMALMGVVVKWLMSHIDSKDQLFVKAIREKDLAYEQLSVSCRHEIAELTAVIMRHIESSAGRQHRTQPDKDDGER